MSLLEFEASWETLSDGSPEEQATFSSLGIKFGGEYLSEGSDLFVKRIRQAPYLPAYTLAEWLTWNWWRLRWEPRSAGSDWQLSHNMASVGGGYVWPNLTVFSDGQRTAVLARPTSDRVATSFRYLSELSVVIPSPQFEAAVDSFVNQVLGQLDAESVSNTNLHNLWEDIRTERDDAALSTRRRLEALMGADPDEADPELLNALEDDLATIGIEGAEELAAQIGQGGKPILAQELNDVADHGGYVTRPAAGMTLPSGSYPKIGSIAAWRVGSSAARAARATLGAQEGPLSNKLLTDAFAVSTNALEHWISSNFAFEIPQSNNSHKVILRSKWETGRRFELARLLGDRLMRFGSQVRPATRAGTYRQKAQRAFAAELLSPFNSIMERLNGDYSNENREDVAEEFNVSPLTIGAVLMNNRVIERDSEWDDFEQVA